MYDAHRFNISINSLFIFLKPHVLYASTAKSIFCFSKAWYKSITAFTKFAEKILTQPKSNKFTSPFNKYSVVFPEFYVTENLENAELKNPIQISSHWEIRKEQVLGSDHLIVAEKRKVECLQEL